MTFINNLFGYPLGYIMWAIYQVFSNYAVAIIIFTLVTKILLIPVSIKQQKNMASNAAFQPKLQALQKKYANNKQKLQEEQMKLYSDEGINPMGSCLPMLIQFPILFGVIDVVYRPMTHIMHFKDAVIEQAAAIAKTFFEATGNLPKNFSGYQQQIYIMQAYSEDPSKFSSIPDFADKVGNFSLKLFGGHIDLGNNPDWTWPILLIPILAGISQLASTIYMQWYQKKTNPAMPSMGAMNSMMYIMPVISVWMAFTFPAGIGFYWTVQAVLSLVQSVILNRIYTPEYVAKLNAKDVAKKKKKRPSMMQRMMEQQQSAQTGGAPVRKIQTTATDEDGEPVKLSKSAQKNLNSKIISDARRRYAEKYGDDYNEQDD